MDETENMDPRRRLRELLAIAERDRTDAQWDEIIELEIRMAPGNTTNSAAQQKAEPGRRAEQKPQSVRRSEQKPRQGARPEQQSPPDATKPIKRFPKRTRRPPAPPTQT